MLPRSLVKPRKAFGNPKRLLSAAAAPDNANGPRHRASKPREYLNDDRKRMLISIYHQSKNFITRETLSKHIDQEFAGDTDRVALRRVEATAGDLYSDMFDRQLRPTMSPISLKGHMSPPMTAFKSEIRRGGRFKQLHAAFKGLDDSLDVGLESVEKLRKDTK